MIEQFSLWTTCVFIEDCENTEWGLNVWNIFMFSFTHNIEWDLRAKMYKNPHKNMCLSVVDALDTELYAESCSGRKNWFNDFPMYFNLFKTRFTGPNPFILLELVKGK